MLLSRNSGCKGTYNFAIRQTFALFFRQRYTNLHSIDTFHQRGDRTQCGIIACLA